LRSRWRADPHRPGLCFEVLDVSLVSAAQREQLRQDLATHDFLHRILRQIEQLHRIVFHDQAKTLDWKHVRASAEEILMGDILTRHGGNIDGVYYALRRSEEAGKTWRQAITDYATYVHNYYTTPLGVLILRDLFGEDCHFITPAAGRLSAARKTVEA